MKFYHLLLGLPCGCFSTKILVVGFFGTTYAMENEQLIWNLEYQGSLYVSFIENARIMLKLILRKQGVRMIGYFMSNEI
jgi:hypothetical protein